MIKKVSILILYFWILFSCLFNAYSWSSDDTQLMLASVYSSLTHTPLLKHYWVSEKYDGVRAYWNGKEFISRQGHVYQAPAWYRRNLPDFSLDGELWLGRGQFDRLSGIVRKKVPRDSEWKLVRYMVFDLPALSENFDRRLQLLNELENLPTWVTKVKQWRVSSEGELLKQLDDLVAQGGEGLMLHDGRSFYHAKRNDDLVKLKPSQDAEAIVVAHVPGKGKYQGQLGAIWVEANITAKNGLTALKRFKIGTGFSDRERQNPPRLGSVISFKYTGLTSKGIPRFARYWRIREQ